MLDRLFALLLILLLLPVFLFISLIILIEDGFPIFFTQSRIGVKNSSFKIYKFRSMKSNTPNVATHLLKNPEKYLLKIGKIIRNYSLDELPNLINILKGEMVFVGPRPALFNQDDLIYLRKLEGIDKLKPGITGLAQINGRDELSLETKVFYDREYLNKKNKILDLQIIFKTIFSVLNKKGISH